MPSLNFKKSPDEAFKKLIRDATRACLKDIAAIAAGGKVHAARRRLKFLNSALRLVRFGLREANYRAAKAHLGQASQLLADARRAEAHAEATAKLAGTDTALAELDAIAARAHAHVSNPASVADAAGAARAEIEALRRSLRDWTLPRRDVMLYLKALRHAYRRARRKGREGLAAKDTATLHEARKSVIHHLHHLEILEPLWPELIGAWTGELTKLRTALGDLNDLAELDRLIADETSKFSSPERRAEAAEAIRQSRTELLKRVGKLVRRLFAEKPQALTRRIGILWTQAVQT